MKYALLSCWTAERTLPVQVALRLVAAFRRTGRPYTWREHDGQPAVVTVVYAMSTRS